MNAIDKDDLNIAAIGIELNKTNFTDRKDKNNPKGQICRHEFMELLVRLAQNKYMLNKKLDTFYEAIKEFFGI